MDSAFRCRELEEYLQGRRLDFQWSPGIFEKLAGTAPQEALPVRACRIWQLRPEVPVEQKFIPYATLLARFGPPKLENYVVAYDGRVKSNDLDQLYSEFDLAPPEGFAGHRITMSDMIELYDHHDRTFYYIDRLGFQSVDFLEE